ncbi:hypothetical protein [Streptomyces alfalfae]|uniref:hypothetical protein n=1 Tax=Streptomyces alfalfae TaxID=1642299 RepID=UPI0028127ED0|nr:hypothetical protein [Streptomyces alfalfae]
MSNYETIARGLAAVSPNAPMTTSALIMGLAHEAGRVVTTREISEAPAIPEGATRTEYASLLRSS